MTVPIWVIPCALILAFLAGPGLLVCLGYCITRKMLTGRWWNR